MYLMGFWAVLTLAAVEAPTLDATPRITQLKRYGWIPTSETLETAMPWGRMRGSTMDGSLIVTDQGLLIRLSTSAKITNENDAGRPTHRIQRLRHDRGPGTYAFIGFDYPQKPVFSDPLPGTINLLRGPRSQWQTGLQRYSRVSFQKVSHGVSVSFALTDEQIVMELDIQPGADLQTLPLIRGHIRSDGTWASTSPASPLPWSSWRWMGDHADTSIVPQKCSADLSLTLEGWDHSTPLHLARSLSWSTFLGGPGGNVWEYATSIQRTSQNHVVICGSTGSADLPMLPEGYNPNFVGWTDAYVLKLSSDASQVLAATFLGGLSDDFAYVMALDAQDRVYVAGDTIWGGFPVTPNALQNTDTGGRDAFFARLSADLSQLDYGTYLGGATDQETIYDIAVSGDGSIFLMGETESSDFPTTPGAFSTVHNGYTDGFVVKLNADFSLAYSTYLGSNWWDSLNACVVDDAGQLAVLGHTESPYFPTTAGAYATAQIGGYDVFLTQFTADGSDMVFSTYLGGTGNDYGMDLALESSSFLILGDTGSTDLPGVAEGWDATYNGGGDAFLMRVSGDGSAIIRSTYFGGDADEDTVFVGLTADGGIATAGTTESTDYPTTLGVFDNQHDGDEEIFVTRFNSDLTQLVSSTFCGTGEGVALFNAGVGEASTVWLCGDTYLGDAIPTTPGVIQASPPGGNDSFAIKMAADNASVVAATYVGGTAGADYVTDIAANASDDLVIGGLSSSPAFPVTPGAYSQTLNAESVDAVIAKIEEASGALIFATYLGGGGYDECRGLVVDDQSRIWITGTTDSQGFPVTPDAFDDTAELEACFVACLDPEGSDLLFSSYLGGNAWDNARDIAMDAAGAIYVTGFTYSTDFPTTPGAFDTIGHAGAYDGFLSKIAPDGSSLLFSTYLGGGGADYPEALSVTADGLAFVFGTTQSYDYPTTPGAFMTDHMGSTDLFITGFNADGSALTASTYFGETSPEQAGDIQLGATGDLFICGTTESYFFPTTDPVFDDTHNGNEDVFVARFPADLSAPIFSTFVGSPHDDRALALTLAPDDTVYVGGTFEETNKSRKDDGGFPVTPDAFDSESEGYKAILMALSPDGQTLEYASFLGGTGADDIYDLAYVADCSQRVYCVGTTSSADFPTTPGSAFPHPPGEDWSGFITGFTFGLAPGFFEDMAQWPQGITILDLCPCIGGPTP